MRIRYHHALAGLVAALTVATTAYAFTEHRATAELEFPLADEANRPVLTTEPLDAFTTARSILGSGWKAQLDRRTGHVHMAYGGELFLSSGVADENAARLAVRDFLALNEDLLGTNSGNMEFRNVARHNGKYAVHYRQVVDGVPVWRTSAFTVLGENGRVMAFGSDFFPQGHEVPARPQLSGADAVAGAAQSLDASPRTDLPILTDLFLVPSADGELMTLQPAWRTVFQTDDPAGRWETFVHAVTGEILSRQNLMHTVNVTGHVEADVQVPGACDGHSIRNLPNQQVNVSGGNNDVTDANGDFDITHGGTSNVTVTAQLLGPFINVNRFSGLGADASFSGTATPGTPYTLAWNGVNSRQDERDTFINGNISHDFIQAVDPTFTQLDYSMPTVVGRTDIYCPGNAWWDGTAINFCEAGSGYGNTGELGNVVYHEYGHGITQEVYGRNGASEPPGGLHEGNSDVMANFNDRQPIIGLGFYSGNCTSGIRNSDNGFQYPAYDENGGHTAGQCIAGVHWDAWQSMLASMPQVDADAAAWSSWHFGRDMGTPYTFPDQVLWTFIADDDDANLDNGTPNHDHLCIGATNHGFTCPEILVGVIITHTKLGHTTDGTAGFDVVADIVSTAAALDPSELKVHYRVNGGSFASILMTGTGNPDEFVGHIPSIADQASTVDYYIAAMDVLGNSRTSPSNAPAGFYSFDVAYAYDDLESGASGWTAGVAGDNATTGQWVLVDPIGTQAQPEDDSTPSPGVNAFITGQCSGPNCSGGCTLGCNDVDGGSTTLLSPVYDMSGATNVRVRFDRWFSNDTGAAPGEDYWLVDVSNNGGSSWTSVENTNASAATWTAVEIDVDALFGTPAQIQVRFKTGDLGSGSIVEAAVDELRVLGDFGGAVDAPIVGVAAGSLKLSLEQNQPNPFRPQTQISFTVPERTNVNLEVYNVAGRSIRQLASGVREAGRYTIDWNGRDAAGERVTAGVYFYRLTAGGEVLTRKMTVLQ